MNNIFSLIPDDISEEVVESLAVSDTIRIERILSKGQSSPVEGWYDQTENEWVMVLKGHGTLEFESGQVKHLKAGDFLHIGEHQKHRVVSTSKDEVTIWLAIFYK